MIGTHFNELTGLFNGVGLVTRLDRKPQDIASPDIDSPDIGSTREYEKKIANKHQRPIL